MRYALILSALFLASCGADGPPRHSQTAPSGVSVGGEVLIGVRTTL